MLWTSIHVLFPNIFMDFNFTVCYRVPGKRRALWYRSGRGFRNTNWECSPKRTTPNPHSLLGHENSPEYRYPMHFYVLHG